MIPNQFNSLRPTAMPIGSVRGMLRTYSRPMSSAFPGLISRIFKNYYFRQSTKRKLCWLYGRWRRCNSIYNCNICGIVSYRGAVALTWLCSKRTKNAGGMIFFWFSYVRFSGFSAFSSSGSVHRVTVNLLRHRLALRTIIYCNIFSSTCTKVDGSWGFTPDPNRWGGLRALSQTL
jgi:hypothetical protein